jgi:hypothetical protein
MNYDECFIFYPRIASAETPRSLGRPLRRDRLHQLADKWLNSHLKVSFRAAAGGARSRNQLNTIL